MERMILSAFFFNPQGDHRVSWRHPRAPLREVYSLAYFQNLAAAAEAAKLDTLFIADHVGMWDTNESNLVYYANPRLEPITLLSSLATVTSKLGLLATISASYTEPYNLARMAASLDHLSQGRAGWNVVTSGMPEEAMNFGLDDNIDHADRYERADEYVDLVKALWDSVEDEALLLDRASGFFADAASSGASGWAGLGLPTMTGSPHDLFKIVGVDGPTASSARLGAVSNQDRSRP